MPSLGATAGGGWPQPARRLGAGPPSPQGGSSRSAGGPAQGRDEMNEGWTEDSVAGGVNAPGGRRNAWVRQPRRSPAGLPAPRAKAGSPDYRPSGPPSAFPAQTPFPGRTPLEAAPAPRSARLPPAGGGGGVSAHKREADRACLGETGWGSEAAPGGTPSPPLGLARATSKTGFPPEVPTAALWKDCARFRCQASDAEARPPSVGEREHTCGRW